MKGLRRSDAPVRSQVPVQRAAPSSTLDGGPKAHIVSLPPNVGMASQVTVPRAKKRGVQFTLAGLMRTVTLSAVLSAIVAGIGLEGYQRIGHITGSELCTMMFLGLIVVLPVGFAYLLYDSVVHRCARCGARLAVNDERCPQCANTPAK